MSDRRNALDDLLKRVMERLERPVILDRNWPVRHTIDYQSPARTLLVESVCENCGYPFVEGERHPDDECCIMQVMLS